MKLDQAIALYIGLRDEKAALKKKFAESVEGIDAKLKKLEAAFLKGFEQSGQTSAKANGVGVAFIKERTTDKVVDREAYLAFVRENDHFDMVESRVNKTALDEYVEEHGDLPPGVSRSTERIVQVRRG